MSFYVLHVFTSIFLQPILSRITFEAFINEQEPVRLSFFFVRIQKKKGKEINKRKKNKFDSWKRKFHSKKKKKHNSHSCQSFLISLIYRSHRTCTYHRGTVSYFVYNNTETYSCPFEAPRSYTFWNLYKHRDK